LFESLVAALIGTDAKQIQLAATDDEGAKKTQVTDIMVGDEPWSLKFFYGEEQKFELDTVDTGETTSVTFPTKYVGASYEILKSDIKKHGKPMTYLVGHKTRQTRGDAKKVLAIDFYKFTIGDMTSVDNNNISRPIPGDFDIEGIEQKGTKVKLPAAEYRKSDLTTEGEKDEAWEQCIKDITGKDPLFDEENPEFIFSSQSQYNNVRACYEDKLKKLNNEKWKDQGWHQGKVKSTEVLRESSFYIARLDFGNEEQLRDIAERYAKALGDAVVSIYNNLGELSSNIDKYFLFKNDEEGDKSEFIRAAQNNVQQLEGNIQTYLQSATATSEVDI